MSRVTARKWPAAIGRLERHSMTLRARSGPGDIGHWGRQSRPLRRIWILDPLDNVAPLSRKDGDFFRTGAAGVKIHSRRITAGRGEPFTKRSAAGWSAEFAE